MEQYDSPEALDAHGKTDYFREANKQLAGFVAGAPESKFWKRYTLRAGPKRSWRGMQESNLRPSVS